NDKKNFILYRSKSCFVIMNMFPYNNGHLMIVPFKHISSLEELSKDEISDLFITTQLSERILQKVYAPDGMNIGMNLGKAAGAGIDEHIHVHIVPRWNGDVNFMASVGGMRVIPESFERAYQQLKEQFDNEKVKK
ncbi:MAG: HIT domain-containing protein, partial [Candidatus Cloacimonetes bacterium]|nr:HIT domain-containing protein [Candidatus Cloacimonadota bacterium]